MINTLIFLVFNLAIFWVMFAAFSYDTNLEAERGPGRKGKRGRGQAARRKTQFEPKSKHQRARRDS